MPYFKITLAFYLFSLNTIAQKTIEKTQSFEIKGLVEKPVNVSFLEINEMSKKDIGAFKVTNHLGELRKNYENLKGVLLIDILSKIKINSPSPRELSEYYLVFKGSDGYTAVYSWNEVFNTEIGKSIYIITDENQRSYSQSPDNILVICNSDYKTGRRHIKGLTSIDIKRAE